MASASARSVAPEYHASRTDHRDVGIRSAGATGSGMTCGVGGVCGSVAGAGVPPSDEAPGSPGFANDGSDSGAGGADMRGVLLLEEPVARVKTDRGSRQHE